MVVPWISASAFVNARNTASARSFTSDGASHFSMIARMCLRCRPCGCGGISKSTFTHAIPARITGLTDAVTPSSPSRAGSPMMKSGSRPTATSAPRVMSPAIPLNGSRSATRILHSVRRAAASVEHQHLGVAGNAAACHQLLSHGERSTTFGSGIDARHASDATRGVADRLLAHRVCVAAAVLDGLEDQPVSQWAGNAQAAGMRHRILPRRRAIEAGFVRPDDGCTTLRLRDDHLRQFRGFGEPAAIDHFLKHFPHADETRAAAGGIDDVRRQPPSELFGELETHGLLALDAIWLAQRGYVEVSGLLGKGTSLLSGVSDVAGHEVQIRTERANGLENRPPRGFRSIDAPRKSSRRAVSGERSPRVPSRWGDQSRDAQSLRARDRRTHPSGLEGRRRIQPFVLDPERSHADSFCNP